MPEYLAPGVYVEEVDTGPKPIGLRLPSGFKTPIGSFFELSV